MLPLHIILDTVVTKPGNEWRLHNENLCRENRIPFELLHDPESSVSESLALEFSPVFYILDKNGKIVYDGNLKTAFEYWSVFHAFDAT